MLTSLPFPPNWDLSLALCSGPVSMDLGRKLVKSRVLVQVPSSRPMADGPRHRCQHLPTELGLPGSPHSRWE